MTAFFMPREAVWNNTQGWLKAYEKRRALGQAVSQDPPQYFPLSALSPKDYHMFLDYDYRFIDYVSVIWSCDYRFIDYVSHSKSLEI